ncbi:hypothetical protein DIPPA_07467 [Diplonema papillatum]|nr:hypothetical protein DIPPA_07467 [Diplonema papillatum]
MSHWSTPAKGTDPPNAPPNTRQSAALSPRGYSSSPAALQRRRQSKGLAAHPEFWRSASGHHLGIPQSPRKSPSAPRQQPSGGAGSPRGGPAAPQENWASAASPHDMLSPRASPRLNVSLATHSPGPTPSSPSNGHPSAAGLGAGGAGVPQIFVSTATGSSPSTVVHALANSSLSSSAAPSSHPQAGGLGLPLPFIHVSPATNSSASRQEVLGDSFKYNQGGGDGRGGASDEIAAPASWSTGYSSFFADQSQPPGIVAAQHASEVVSMAPKESASEQESAHSAAVTHSGFVYPRDGVSAGERMRYSALTGLHTMHPSTMRPSTAFPTGDSYRGPTSVRAPSSAAASSHAGAGLALSARTVPGLPPAPQKAKRQRAPAKPLTRWFDGEARVQFEIDRSFDAETYTDPREPPDSVLLRAMEKEARTAVRAAWLAGVQLLAFEFRRDKAVYRLARAVGREEKRRGYFEIVEDLGREEVLGRGGAEREELTERLVLKGFIEPAVTMDAEGVSERMRRVRRRNRKLAALQHLRGKERIRLDDEPHALAAEAEAHRIMWQEEAVAGELFSRCAREQRSITERAVWDEFHTHLHRRHEVRSQSPASHVEQGS